MTTEKIRISSSDESIRHLRAASTWCGTTIAISWGQMLPDGNNLEEEILVASVRSLTIKGTQQVGQVMRFEIWLELDSNLSFRGQKTTHLRVPEGETEAFINHHYCELEMQESLASSSGYAANLMGIEAKFCKVFAQRIN